MTPAVWGVVSKGREGTVATRYRVARKGASEWLDKDGRLTTDEWAAASFASATEAMIFLIESMDDTSLFVWEPVRERCPVCLHVMA